jgi:hypothetical protein
LCICSRCFGCSLWLRMPLNPPARGPSSSVSRALTSDNGRAPGRMVDTLLRFYLSPTQNILPFTQLVLKLVVCVQRSAGIVPGGPGLARSGHIDTLWSLGITESPDDQNAEALILAESWIVRRRPATWRDSDNPGAEWMRVKGLANMEWISWLQIVHTCMLRVSVNVLAFLQFLAETPFSNDFLSTQTRIQAICFLDPSRVKHLSPVISARSGQCTTLAAADWING